MSKVQGKKTLSDCFPRRTYPRTVIQFRQIMVAQPQPGFHEQFNPMVMGLNIWVG